jgi:hypothetical protein
MRAVKAAATLFAVGRNAERLLRDIARLAIPLRHPSMGGATAFRDGLRRAWLWHSHLWQWQRLLQALRFDRRQHHYGNENSLLRNAR